MPKFLFDENLSPRLAEWLRAKNYEVNVVRDIGLKGKSDEEIIRWLKENNCVLITSDLDFGEFFYWKEFGDFGVIVLRTKFQSINAFKEILMFLHVQGILHDERLNDSLLVSDNEAYRWRRFYQ